MTDDEIRAFCEERDTAFINAVLYDDWDGFFAYCKRWDIPAADKGVSMRIVKAAVYGGIQELTRVPESVKEVARLKRVKLGFKPSIDWENGGSVIQ